MGVGKRHARKLLVASLGVAAVSYVGCGGNAETSGNLVAPDSGADQTIDVPVGNLVAPDTGTPDAQEDNSSQLDVVANLVAPDVAEDVPDLDAAADVDASD